MKKNFINIDDFSKDQILRIIAISTNFKSGKVVSAGIRKRDSHNDKTGILIFEKPSLRTKLSFFKALNILGFDPIYFSPEEVGMGQRERIADMAKVVSKMSDLIILRTFKHETIEEFADNSSVPVINALSNQEHPCQALGDLLTITENIDTSLEEVKLTFVGDGNNVATSLAKAFSLLGGTFIHCVPQGYEIQEDQMDQINKYNGKSNGQFILERDLKKATAETDFIYTDVWTSMGQESEKKDRLEKFKEFQITEEILTNSSGKFMHDLPANHGEEISEGLLDHPQSIVFDQAENRTWGQAGIIHYIFSD